MTRIICYVDGACKNNGRHNSIAGYGVHYPNRERPDKSITIGGNVTNIRAEMIAVLDAANDALKDRIITEIRTDSLHCVKGFNEWLPNWIIRAKIKRHQHDHHGNDPTTWRNSNGGVVAHIDLWTEILKCKNFIRLVHVQGHSDIEGNVIADRLANLACQ